MSGAATRYRLARGVLAQTALPRAIVLDSAGGRYAELNEVGSTILRALLDGATRGELAALVAGRFDVAIEVAELDCEQFLATLLRDRIIEPG